MREALLVGPRAIEEALDQSIPLDRVWVEHTRVRHTKIASLLERLSALDIPWQQASPQTILKMSKGKSSVYIIARPSVKHFAKLEDVIAHSYEKGAIPCVLGALYVKDVRNIGAIARSSACFKIDALVVGKSQRAALGADALQASAGALLEVPVCRMHHIQEGIEALKHMGLQVIAAGTSSKKPCFEVDFCAPTALIVGAEAHGLSKEIWNLADERVCIPMHGHMNSLNVASAASILLYEVMRQRHS